MPKEDSDKFFKLQDKIDNTLLDARRIFISDAIDNDSAQETIRKLWYLDIKDSGKPITLVINSPGGSVDSGFAIWDQVKMLKSPVYTLITGLAASMGSIISLCASPGKRFATENARIMIHQPAIHGFVKGQATDLEIQAQEIIKTRHILVNIYVQANGKDFKTVDKAIDRDLWMTAEESLEFGLLDKIVRSYEEVDTAK